MVSQHQQGGHAMAKTSYSAGERFQSRRGGFYQILENEGDGNLEVLCEGHAGNEIIRVTISEFIEFMSE